MRKQTREIQIGKLKIGNNNPIAVQSMLNKRSDLTQDNVEQAIELRNAGCDVIRISVLDLESVNNIYEIKKKVDIPIVADVHFDPKLVIESVHAGVDKVRINPGNINFDNNIKNISKLCLEKKIPIRIGINSGSLEHEVLSKYNKICAEAMYESAVYNIKLLEKHDFNNIVISAKCSDVRMTIDTYKLISERCIYPLHLGVTEAGTETMGTIKSAIGIGSLLASGIGDTIRVSLTENPVKEVKTGINILKCLNLYKNNVNIISCPTCGRTKIDIINITKKVEKLLENSRKNIKIAIMGCAVNGPGEAKDADIGIAGGDRFGIIFKKGQILKKVPEQDLIKELLNEINLL